MLSIDQQQQEQSVDHHFRGGTVTGQTQTYDKSDRSGGEWYMAIECSHVQ